MTVREAVAAVTRALTDELVVCTTGFISRDACAAADRPGNFYMIGSMGLAPAIGLGLAVTRPSRRVVVFDGDGALLMALGTLAMAAQWKPKNFYHVVFDNEAYASTGHQPTPTREVALDAVAAASGYARVARVESVPALTEALAPWLAAPGPAFLLVKCARDAAAPSGRIPHAPPAITQRVMQAAGASA
ncbi:MAG: sulfopyruvate decarboxylase subunit beta [Candidatus Omnitrophica bacterium]|nr:sulfopyruvate decarboxylase subunit beta [Candidatus Omnitrophota bacterium]